jgi:hypothetical protein
MLVEGIVDLLMKAAERWGGREGGGTRSLLMP